MPDAGRAGRPRSPSSRRQPLLEHPVGRVGVARIDEAGLVAGEARVGAFGRVVDEALGQVEGFGRLAVFAAVQAAADQLGGRIPQVGVLERGRSLLMGRLERLPAARVKPVGAGARPCVG